MTHTSRITAKDWADDPRIEQVLRTHDFVPPSLYDEVTNPAESALAELMEERASLAGLLADAEKALREIAKVTTDDPIRDAAEHRKIARDALAAFDAAGEAGKPGRVINTATGEGR